MSSIHRDENVDGESFSVRRRLNRPSGGGWKIASRACRRGDLGDSRILVMRRETIVVVSTDCAIQQAISKQS